MILGVTAGGICHAVVPGFLFSATTQGATTPTGPAVVLAAAFDAGLDVVVVVDGDEEVANTTALSDPATRRIPIAPAASRR